MTHGYSWEFSFRLKPFTQFQPFTIHPSSGVSRPRLASTSPTAPSAAASASRGTAVRDPGNDRISCTWALDDRKPGRPWMDPMDPVGTIKTISFSGWHLWHLWDSPETYPTISNPSFLQVVVPPVEVAFSWFIHNSNNSRWFMVRLNNYPISNIIQPFLVMPTTTINQHFSMSVTRSQVI